MLPFIDIARTVLPLLIDLITDDRKTRNASEMRDRVSEIVQDTTGETDPDKAKEKARDPAVENQLRIRLTELALEAQRLDAEQTAQFNAQAQENTFDARRNLLQLLNKPDSFWVTLTPSILSYIVVVGFFLLVILLMFGKSLSSAFDGTNDAFFQIVNICVGAIAAGFATVLNFWLGSSLGSRRKDDATALTTTVEKVKELTTPKPQSSTGGSEAKPVLPRPSGPTSGGSATSEPAAPLELPRALIGVGRSTDPSTVNVRKDVPPGGGVPASFRYNNPGAQYPCRDAARFGQIGFGIIGGNHKIARFPSAVNGAAANFDLLYRKYTGMTIGAAGKTWTGDHGFGIPGFDPNIVLSKEMLDAREQAIALMKAIARREAGKELLMSDEQWRHAYDMFKAGSADTFLAKFGRRPAEPPQPIRPDNAPDKPLEELIVDALRRMNLAVHDQDGQVNIVYVEGMNEDGSPNNDEANKFNDLRCVITFRNGEPIMLGKWQATTEPGYFYDRDHPINRDGAARIKFGQYKDAWKVGMHRGNHEALVQVGNVTVCRDLNRDMERTGDAEQTGLFGINQHWGYDQPADNIGKASAGCLVGRTKNGHRAFMEIVKSDPRFVHDAGFLFTSTILAAADILGPGEPEENA